MDWISVKEQLPEFKQKVLLYHTQLRFPHVGEMVFMDERGYHFRAETIVFDCNENREKCCEGFTHWMPLPEPPIA